MQTSTGTSSLFGPELDPVLSPRAGEAATFSIDESTDIPEGLYDRMLVLAERAGNGEHILVKDRSGKLHLRHRSTLVRRSSRSRRDQLRKLQEQISAEQDNATGGLDLSQSVNLTSSCDVAPRHGSIGLASKRPDLAKSAVEPALSEGSTDVPLSPGSEGYASKVFELESV